MYQGNQKGRIQVGVLWPQGEAEKYHEKKIFFFQMGR